MTEPTMNDDKRTHVTPLPWEKQLLQNVLFASLKEQRASRRWKIFFRFFFALILLAYLAFIISINAKRAGDEVSEGHVGVVDVNGTIMAGEDASAEQINGALRKAFENKSVRAVILRVNSPGGSPVQAEQIYDEIRRLRVKYDKPVYAVIEDAGASAAYYVASAADEIYVSRSSLVGSIGVLMNGFGVVDLMDKIGIERRLITSGGHKGIMDPFSPMQPGDKEFVEKMLNRIHQQFIAAVKQGRGSRLKIDEDTFSGLFWPGDEAIERGLADGLGTVGSVAREKVGVDKMVNYTQNKSMFERFAHQLGAGIGDVAVDAVKSNNIQVQ